MPFGEWYRGRGREFRGIRTRRYTYVRDLKGPWLLYDNQQDPYQLKNLARKPDSADLQKRLDLPLAGKLKATSDDFLPGTKYIEKWDYKVNSRGTVPYRNQPGCLTGFRAGMSAKKWRRLGGGRPKRRPKPHP